MAEATQPDPQPDRRRRTFGPVVLVGLASAGLAAVAGAKPWASGTSGSIDSSSSATAALGSSSLETAAESPLAAALALVVLACWGVLLVTRGVFRRAIAVLALVAAVGLAVVTVEGLWSVPRKLTDALFELSGSDTAQAGLTGWYVAAAVGAVACVATTAAAVRLVRSWPEMGTRYDAPAGATSGDAAREDLPTENIDIWKALDEGRDPTA
ncbi:Trp biosynthesis-associated membrane protein [Nocardioides baculatus]|uniref:Trp biosynthesis-associated membrane protein n=1 Tax=Nocardioides baculatus TaxID=2801337 RepID=A0ABS1L9K2_9ACTN|nr:Trp biosynthesis-associated membrane protein [Nocardioides baculatus]MBL0748217.1 Trp biosynthesis-associated membrane protein [Nocardioides baculatus]